jgi:hypothetical protein
MPKSKKPERSTGDQAEELEELQPADAVEQDDDVDPNEAAPAKKKKKTKKGQDVGSAKPPKKKKGEAQAEVQSDDDEPQADADVEGVEIDWEKVREWVKEFRSSNRRLPYATELATSTGFSAKVSTKIYKKMKAEADALVNKKKGKRIRGYTMLAREVGYGFTPEVDKEGNLTTISRVDSGTDMIRPIISMADTLRLATFVPLTEDAVSVSQQDFQEKLELVKTTLSAASARAITASVDPMLRYIMNTGVKNQIAIGGTKLNPSTLESVLAPMTAHLAFSNVLTPAGLIKYSADEAPPARKEFDQGDKGLAEWKKAVKAFNKRVKPNDRGIGAVEVDSDDKDAANRATKNAADAVANGKLYGQVMAALTKEKAAAKAEKAKAAKARAEAAAAK